MTEDDYYDKFREYLNKIKDPKDDKCWFCKKTPGKIREEFFEYMKNPDEQYQDFDLEDIVVMTYKTRKPACAACYFAIKENPDLVKEILERPQEEIW